MLMEYSTAVVNRFRLGVEYLPGFGFRRFTVERSRNNTECSPARLMSVFKGYRSQESIGYFRRCRCDALRSDVGVGADDPKCRINRN